MDGVRLEVELGWTALDWVGQWGQTMDWAGGWTSVELGLEWVGLGLGWVGLGWIKLDGGVGQWLGLLSIS